MITGYKINMESCSSNSRQHNLRKHHLFYLLQVLKLLKKAWQRRLIFTIGMSTTTGVQDTVIWNEIHHKTEAFSNHMGHGFPDPNYLDNVLAELAAQGVQDDEESENLQE